MCLIIENSFHDWSNKHLLIPQKPFPVSEDKNDSFSYLLLLSLWSLLSETKAIFLVFDIFTFVSLPIAFSWPIMVSPEQFAWHDIIHKVMISTKTPVPGQSRIKGYFLFLFWITFCLGCSFFDDSITNLVTKSCRELHCTIFCLRNSVHAFVDNFLD